MNTSDELTAQEEALVRLDMAASKLARARDHVSETLADMRNAVIDARTAGVLTVAQIAAAIGRERNVVDAIWASTGRTVKGRQTRVDVSESDASERGSAIDRLHALASVHKEAVETAELARGERDRQIQVAYAAKTLGPSAIARATGIDRNHVLRLVRKAGVGPAHRTNIKNQYTKAK